MQSSTSASAVSGLHTPHKKRFARKLDSYHLMMLSLGGVIGTGLFLSSGYTLGQAGPLGTILAYFSGAVVVYLVMLCLGQLAVVFPETGSFHVYATRFISPGVGYVVAWLYWLCWTVALGTEFLGAGLLMQRWFPHVPAWLFAAIFAALIFALNALSVRAFGNAEVWFAAVKVLAIIVFIILGGLAIFGVLPYQGTRHFIGASNIFAHGVLPHGLPTFLSVLLTVNYAFSGTELIGVAAGETRDPQKAIPTALKLTVSRLVLFFILTIVVLAALVPMKEAGVSQAPFVLVFERLNIPFAADLMNFVILTAILSAGNSGLYASARMLWSLADQGTLPRAFAKLDQRGVPMVALIASMAGAGLALFASVYTASTVFVALTAIAGFAVVVVWLAIPVAQLRFAHQVKTGKLTAKGGTHLAPVVPVLTIGLLVLSIIGIGWDSSQRAGLLFGIPACVLLYLYHRVRYKRW